MNLFKICKNYVGLLFNDLYTIDTYLLMLLIILSTWFKYPCSTFVCNGLNSNNIKKHKAGQGR